MAHELFHDLMSGVCQCGRKKRPKQTFCGYCYASLPSDLQHRLYSRMGEGYEEAHAAAMKVLMNAANGVEV